MGGPGAPEAGRRGRGEFPVGEGGQGCFRPPRSRPRPRRAAALRRSPRRGTNHLTAYFNWSAVAHFLTLVAIYLHEYDPYRFVLHVQ